MNDSDIHPGRIVTKGLAHRIGGFDLGPLDLDVPSSSITALIGPNGAGKTTLLDLLFGMGRPQRGTISIGELHQPTDGIAIRQRVGFVAPDLTYASWGRVGAALDYVSGFYPDWREGECERLLGLFGLDRREKISGLSFGARTKLSLIVALSRDTDALLLDEPTTGLDTVARRDLFTELLAYVRRPDRTVIISSHQLSELERLADRIIILDEGRLLASGSADAVIERYEQWDVVLDRSPLPLPLPEGTRVLASGGGRMRIMVDLHGPAPHLPEGTEIAARTGMSLEEVYLGLTGGAR